MKVCLKSAGGLEYWNGLNCCKKPSTFSRFTNLLHALFRHPVSKFWGSKVTAYLITFQNLILRLGLGYLFSHLHALIYVEVYLQSLVTTIVFYRPADIPFS